MIIALKLKNFYSLRDEAVLDFTVDSGSRKEKNYLPENLIEFSGDYFVNIIGLFGGNAAGKSNLIKGVDFCRNFVLTSHLNNEGNILDFEPFKFDSDKSSEFYIDFVTEGIEYEYSFELCDGKIIRESLYYYPNKRKAKIFTRENSSVYTYGKGLIHRPKEIEANTGLNTLFLSRASSMNRPIAQIVYRFFLQKMVIGLGDKNVFSLTPKNFDSVKQILLRAFEVSDSDIVDIRLKEYIPGQFKLESFHREDPKIPFDFEREESDGTKRLLWILLMMLDKVTEKAAIFFDEFDLRLHLFLAEFLLDVVRDSHGAQLVFTSHNPALINTSALRREQIVFVTKDKHGNSEFIPLSDYEGLRVDMNIQKAYLQGRFDGIPYIGNSKHIFTSTDSGDERKKI
ncbi:MAG: ATP-binding protein [Muribaculaceae bacterium]|nr:ATP-binding protein [Muribaculaceae bacterium]